MHARRAFRRSALGRSGGRRSSTQRASLIVEAGPKKKAEARTVRRRSRKQTVLDVLEAPPAFGSTEGRSPSRRSREIPEVEARWSALSIDEKARLLELANSKRVRGEVEWLGRTGEPRRRP